MSNTAEVIKFPAPLQGQQESRMAELENGYLRLANQIQDALCIVELSGREFRVLNAIEKIKPDRQQPYCGQNDAEGQARL